ncbi:GNAT family N-acetyltransferase [Clostridium boliviensis]|uniref:GNAT family N-acetyltransferase n=1 Tax=Clostridium boliviensis TaxID=318465 RepID=A0ABU4GPU8_9CLOT|nr:GNAT family N-acetyltransferase [Clostridium boliviensis]MDW2799670.1 GNAT family N-acetyltransferase [Clostridium boliviensis]
MKINIKISGYSYRLRPVTIDDAQTIIDIRLQDIERNRYIHKISSDLLEQTKWIKEYMERDNDYYFIIENIFTEKTEGLISIYDINNDKAEWGRWVLKKGSMASVESVYLILKVAFEKLGLKEAYSRTIEKNTSVVAFHDSIGQKHRRILKNYVQLSGENCNAVEHFINKEYFFDTVDSLLQMKSLQVFKRNMEAQIGEKLIFHHIGVATVEIKKELPVFYMIGYKLCSEIFIDEIQGIKGCFLEMKNGPRIELLENLPESDTLSRFQENNQKMYHIAYYVKNLDQTIYALQKCRAKVLSSSKVSNYFKKRICFLILTNKLMIELIEE